MVGLVVEFVRRCVHFLWSDGFWWMLVRVCAAVLFLRCVHSFVVRWILMDVNRTVCGQWQPPCALWRDRHVKVGFPVREMRRVFRRGKVFRQMGRVFR